MGWARLDDDRHDHPKILNLGDDLHALAAIGLLDHAITWARRHARESSEPGFVPWSFWRSRAGRNASRLTSLLLRERLIDSDLDGRGFWIHDFADYGPRRNSEEASEAGKRGAAARWGNKPEADGNSHAIANGSCHQDGMANDASRASARAFPTRPDLEVQEQHATPIKPSATTTGCGLLDEHFEGVTTPRKVKQRTGEAIDELLGEGFSPDHVREALRRLRERNAGPGLLPDLVGDVVREQSPRRRSDVERMFG